MHNSLSSDDEINLEMYDSFFHLDIYRNNKDRLTYRFLLDFRSFFFSPASATSLEDFLTFILFFTLFTTFSSSFLVLLRVSIGEDEA